MSKDQMKPMNVRVDVPLPEELTTPIELTPETIRELRTKQRLSREALAAKVGVNRTTIIRWDTGAVRPNADRALLYRLVAALLPERIYRPEQPLLIRVTGEIPMDPGDVLWINRPDGTIAVVFAVAGDDES